MIVPLHLVTIEGLGLPFRDAKQLAHDCGGRYMAAIPGTPRMPRVPCGFVFLSAADAKTFQAALKEAAAK